MQVSNIKAEPNPRGGRIDLSWTNPIDGAFGGVKILRRESTFPEISDIGTDREIGDIPVAAAAGGALAQFSDANLKSERVYYYALVAYDLAVIPSAPSFAKAMATAPYETAAHLYKNLPSISRRYDTSRPPDIVPLAADREKGQLQRLVEMVGSQFDLLRSSASAMNTFSDRERVDGVLLPLLASWIGWETNYGVDFDKQRGEIQYAPHYYRTTGIPASLRATVNRLVSWDTRIKEFVHNVFLSSGPEQLTVWEKQNNDAVWQDPRLVSLDVAYEGRPAVLLTADKRQWLFQHVRESPPLSSEPALKEMTRDQWHIWYKLSDQDAWLAARQISFGGEVNKYPTSVEDNDGRVWIFWTHYEAVGTASIPEIRLSLLATGQPARPARFLGTVKGPFTFSDGDTLQIKVTTASRSFTREVTFRPEHFRNAASATAGETAALLDREIPDVSVSATADDRILFRTSVAGLASQLEFPASAVAPLIGVTGTVKGSDAVAAEMTSRQAPTFALADGDDFSVRIDGRIGRAITFSSSDFADITQATAVEIAAVINRTLPGVAQAVSNRVKLSSTAAGESSSVIVEVFPRLLFSLGLSFKSGLDSGSISSELRTEFDESAIPLSSAATLAIQIPGSHWLITDGSRHYLITEGPEKLDVYNPSLAAPKLGFGAPLPAPAATVFESEPCAMKDATGLIWLFWSSRRNGIWKIWYNRFDGNAWGAPKTLTTGSDSDREPAVLFAPSGGGRIWVFWSRKKSNGLWNIFFRTTLNFNFPTLGDADWPETELTPVPPNYDNREPNAIVQIEGADPVELYFSSNRTDGWHVWSKVVTTATQSADTQLVSGHFTHRGPAILKVSDKLKKLYFRSNESQVYSSKLYPAAETIDARYSGSTTADTRNVAKISLRKNIKDIQRYTYDTLKGNENWYARDTIGIYLVPDTIDQALIIRRRNQIEKVLRRFLPIQVRTVFIVDQVFTEFVFAFDAPPAESPTLIRDEMIDTILGEALWGPLSDAVRGPTDLRFDRADFQWLRTFDEENKGGLLPDLTLDPPTLSFRLFLRDVAEPGEE